MAIRGEEITAGDVAKSVAFGVAIGKGLDKAMDKGGRQLLSGIKDKVRGNNNGVGSENLSAGGKATNLVEESTGAVTPKQSLGDSVGTMRVQPVFDVSSNRWRNPVNGQFVTSPHVANRRGNEDVFHTVTNPAAGQGVLSGIDPRFLNPDSRFGKAFYISDDAPTTIAELTHHGAKGSHTIRYNLNHDNANILDFTDPAIAKKWGYDGGDITPETKSMGTKAAESGYNRIKFPSLRGEGANYGVLSDFDEVLTPEMVVPTP